MYYVGTFSKRGLARIEAYPTAEAAWDAMIAKPIGRGWPLPQSAALPWLRQDYPAKKAEEMLRKAERRAKTKTKL